MAEFEAKELAELDPKNLEEPRGAEGPLCVGAGGTVGAEGAVAGTEGAKAEEGVALKKPGG